jgi:hypothetical protein
MRVALYINLGDALDRRGCIVALTASEQRLADFLTSVVAAATNNLDGSRSTLRCRRRPGHKPCTGMVEAGFSSYDEIYWICPHCSDSGMIADWKGTFWDLTDMTLGPTIF